MIDFSTGPEVEEFMVVLPGDRHDRLLTAKDRLLDHLARALPRLRFALADVPALQDPEDFVVVPVMSVEIPGKEGMRLCRSPDPEVFREIGLALRAFESGSGSALN